MGGAFNVTCRAAILSFAARSNVSSQGHVAPSFMAAA